ncbi:MAG TPA: rod shape-determining protein MreC [Rhizomicrobium sp.]|jgi:rod shape-determining protein MreC
MANGSLRLARNRGGAPISLAVCAVLALTLIFLGRVQPMLFDRARAYASDRAAPVLETLRLPLRSAEEWVGGLGHLFDVYQENQRLKTENARLRQWQSAALVLDQRLKRYQLLLNAVPDPGLGSITAHVIGRANRPFLNTMILDAGRRQQVKPGEAVVDDRGMIGRIYIAGDHTSWVILLSDLNSRIPVAIEPGDVQAIMIGDNSPAPFLEVSTQEAHLKSGQQVVTSGDGALLPAGLAIGKIHWDGSEFRAALQADAGHSEDVRVLDLKTPAENPPVPSVRDLPVTAAGLPPLSPPPPKTTAPPAPIPIPAPQPTRASPKTAAPKAAATPQEVAPPPKPAAQPSPDDQPAPDDQ